VISSQGTQTIIVLKGSASPGRSNPLKLEQFLVKAKISGYASGGEGGEGILADGGKELTFQEDDVQYRDRYFGWNPFCGEEVVWQAGYSIGHRRFTD
jgi:hypothetical protein